MTKAPRNRTITLTEMEKKIYSQELLKLDKSILLEQILNKVINQDIFEIVGLLPSKFVDLVFIDPPYNLAKTFNTRSFKRMSTVEYME